MNRSYTYQASLAASISLVRMLSSAYLKFAKQPPLAANVDSKVGASRVGNKFAAGLEYVCYQTRRAPMRPLLDAMLPDPKYELNT